MLTSRLGVKASEAIPRVATAAMLLLSIGFVVFDQSLFRVDAIYPQISSLLFAVLLAVGAVRIKGSYRRTKFLLGVCTIYWSIFSAFFLFAVSPLLIINSFLVFLVAIYIERHLSIMATMVLVIGTEAGYILGPTHTLEQLLFLSIHLLSLVLIVLLGSWYQGLSRNLQVRRDQQTEQARVERERLQALINSMTDGVVATDTDGNVAVYNGSSLDLLNLNASLEGRNVTEFLNVIDKAGTKIDVMMQAKQQQGYLVSRDYLLSLDELENVNLYISISPVKIGFGHEDDEGYIMLLRDITREKSLEEERDEFISVVSHELRTPITIAEGNISNAELVAEKEQIPEGVTSSLAEAHKQVVFLSDMINDLATLSRAERGKLQSAPEDIDVHELVKSLQSDYRASAQQKDVEFKTHVDREVDAIFTSRLYLREILQNFITNAIKYTREGDVVLNVVMSGSRVQFSVKDSGIGISKTDQKHLFTKFFRSEDYRTRESNGTGLGLYVTMKLAKLINAQIGVTSELNKGSTFIVTVPSMRNRPVDIA